MARLLRSSGVIAAGVQHFDIRPDQDHLVLRGNGDEASSVLLKGTLVFCNTEPLKVQDISLRLSGIAKTEFAYFTAGNNMRIMKQETEFFRHQWKFDLPTPNPKNIIPAGNHEWPFDLVIPGDLPESVEGYHASWIIYRLKAVADRGLFARNLEARHHVRLIRTFDPSALDLSQSVSISNVWPDKISYTISSPSKGVPFGGTVSLDFRLVPLLKGMRIGNIQSTLVETTEITVYNKGDGTRTQQTLRDIVNDSYDLPEDAETQDVDGAEGYILSRSIDLPRCLKKCMQSVNEMNILVKHHLKFVISLHNPDGHLSALRASLPVNIFISPHIRLNEENEIDTSLTNGRFPVDVLALAAAPPGYGDHQLDTLYTEVDPQSFTTPGPSQPQSRRSSEGGDEADDAESTAAAAAELSANTLRNRLANLQMADGDGNTATDSSSAARTTEHHRPSVRIQVDGASPPLEANGNRSRNPSTDDSQHIEFDTEALSRVPSYNTAMHTSTRTPVNAELPVYDTTTDQSP